jgi:membrane-associated phospholipid phosphatase
MPGLTRNLPFREYVCPVKVELICLGLLRRCGIVLRGAGGLYAVPVACSVILFAILMVGSARYPGGIDWGGGLGIAMVLIAVVWGLGLLARCAQPGSRLAAAIEGTALFAALCLLPSLASAALVKGGGDYIDPHLAALDGALFPYLDWRAMVLGLPDFPILQQLLSRFYVALNWQAFFFLGVAFLIGRQRDMGALLNAWSIGLLLCILPFYWLPALGPYPYYGIGLEAVPGAQVGLPFQSPGKMEALRSGAMSAISHESISGLVTIPSFHACGAVVFGWAFWRYRLLRWPMVAVNGLMFIAAVPIGGHYFVDVIAGGAVGALAVWCARRLELRPGSAPRPRSVALDPSFG